MNSLQKSDKIASNIETNINILQFDKKIRTYFEEKKALIPELEKKLHDLQTTHKNLKSKKIKKSRGSKTPKQRLLSDLQYNIESLKKEIEELQSSDELNFYITETADLISRFKEQLKTPIKVSFIGVTKIKNKEIDEIVEKYLQIAQKYYDTVFSSKELKNLSQKEKSARLSCDCGNKVRFAMEETACICEECGAQQDLPQNAHSYKDSDRVNISSKYTYDRKVHFRDCINQYQGKQNCTIDQKVYTDLEDALERHHLLCGDKNTRKETRFAKVTKGHIMLFLKELKYAKHYENVTLIHYTLTGKKPDDISHLEEKILADFDRMTDLYDKEIKNTVDRVSFISSPYVLYQLLQKYKHPCKKEDFVMLKTADRKNFHNEICQKLFMELGWTFVPVS